MVVRSLALLPVAGLRASSRISSRVDRHRRPSGEATPRYIPGVLKPRRRRPRAVTRITPPLPPSAPTSAIDLVGGGPRALAEHPHPGADFVGDGGADEIFARAGGGDRAGAVVGIGAGADQRRVADPAPALAGEAAGRGRRGDMAVQRRRRPRRPCRISAPRRNNRPRSDAHLLELAPPLRGLRTIRAATCSRPCSRENWSAPSRLRKTWGLCSITARARLTGFLVAVTPVTAPASRLRPSITAASSSMVP